MVIVGSGPAAWTAAIYAARANLNPLVIEGEPSRDMIPGGQLMYTGDVENFPGFPEGISGQELPGRMKEQAERFGTRLLGENVASVDFASYPFVLTPRTASRCARAPSSSPRVPGPTGWDCPTSCTCP
nr:FAD-dependent oxidoreductase [Longimicrobium terrae]